MKHANGAINSTQSIVHITGALDIILFLLTSLIGCMDYVVFLSDGNFMMGPCSQ